MAVNCFRNKKLWFTGHKVPIFAKVGSQKILTRGIDTRGWGPFVKMKFNISAVFCWRGLFSLEIFFRLETSTSTTSSLNEQLRKCSAYALKFLQCLEWSSFVRSSYHTLVWKNSRLPFLSLATTFSEFKRVFVYCLRKKSS